MPLLEPGSIEWGGPGREDFLELQFFMQSVIHGPQRNQMFSVSSFSDSVSEEIIYEIEYVQSLCGNGYSHHFIRETNSALLQAEGCAIGVRSGQRGGRIRAGRAARGQGRNIHAGILPLMPSAHHFALEYQFTRQRARLYAQAGV